MSRPLSPVLPATFHLSPPDLLPPLSAFSSRLVDQFVSKSTPIRPLRVPPPRMERRSQGKTEDDARRERTRPGASPASSQQQLPPFRELLPPHMHDEIESPRYGEPVGSHASSGTSPSFPVSTSFSRPSPAFHSQERGRAMPSLSEGFGEYPEQYRAPPPPLHDSRRPSLTPSSSNTYLSRTNPQLPYNPNRSASTSLPPFSDIQSLSDRALTADRQIPSHGSHYPTSYTHGTGTFAESERFGPNTTTSYSQPTAQSPQMASQRIYAESETRSGTYRGQYSDMDYNSQYPNGSQPPNFGVMGADSMDARNKRRRGNLPKPVTDILRTWFLEHLDHPYPSEEDKQMFIARTGLSISQISNWFINARRRQLPALRNQVRAPDPERINYEQTMSDLDHVQPRGRSTPPRPR